jgi:ATP-dependent Lon protease
MFIPGWLLPKITEGQLYYGWAIDNEVFSEFLHYLRTETCSSAFFDELVKCETPNVYVRHSKSIRRVASAYCKILFPHVRSLDELTPEELEYFKVLYRDYCLIPAVTARTYIYNELKAIDPEFKSASNAMPVFDVEIGVDADGSADGFPTETEDESEEGDLTMSDDTGEDE